MATYSRTSSATWKAIRKEARANAQSQGLTNCPRCRVRLDWEYSKRPASAEVDHIAPHSKGGLDALENTRIICRRCNQSLGGASNRKKPRPAIVTTDLNPSDIW